MGIFYFLYDWIRFREQKMIETDVYCSICRFQSDRAVQGRKVGGEGVTYNALLLKGRPRFKDHI